MFYFSYLLPQGKRLLKPIMYITFWVLGGSLFAGFLCVYPRGGEVPKFRWKNPTFLLFLIFLSVCFFFFSLMESLVGPEDSLAKHKKKRAGFEGGSTAYILLKIKESLHVEKKNK